MSNPKSRSKLGDTLAELERKIEVPEDVEDRIVNVILGREAGGQEAPRATAADRAPVAHRDDRLRRWRPGDRRHRRRNVRRGRPHRGPRRRFPNAYSTQPMKETSS